MYILLALIAACSMSVALHFVLPQRQLRGVTVTPAIATATTAVVYTIMQWAGVVESDVWLWVVSIGTGLALATASTLVLTSQRTRRDALEKQTLGI